MAGDVSYAADKYRDAVDLLIGEGDLRARVLDAYRESACRIHPLKDGVGPPLPEDLADRLNTLHERLTAAGDGSDGQIAQTVQGMSAEDLAEVASEIHSLSRQLDRALQAARS